MQAIFDGATAKAQLEKELQARIERNPHYSMRGFAKSLGLSHSLLSLILSGKREVSRKTIKKMAKLFPSQEKPLTRVPLQTFESLYRWYDYAILSLLEIPATKMDPQAIAKRLGISPIEARLSLSRLKQNGIIAKKNGKWRQVIPPIIVENNVSTDLTRKHHAELLKKADDSLHMDPFEVRDFSSTTFAVDPEHIPYARKRIRDFRRKLVAELESFGRPKEVYHLSVQLYPVSHGKEPS